MFQGSLVALVTPMHEDGSLDFESLERLLEFHITNGTQGVVIGGTTGEAASLSQHELLELLREAVRVAGGRIAVIGGSGKNSTRKTVALTRAVAATGVDGCLVVTPYYVRPPQRGLFAHFSEVADAAQCPVILYNVPQRTACDLLPETVARLAGHTRIVGIKESVVAIERYEALREGCGTEFAILGGDDAHSCDWLCRGADGVISVTANAAPAAMSQLCAAAAAGETVQARALDGPLRALHAALFLETNPMPVKWALAQMGLTEAGIRLPLVPLARQHQSVLQSALAEAGCLAVEAA